MELATAMAVAKAELDTRLGAVMREKENAEDAISDGKDTYYT
jgi:hypothetical protein